MNLSCLRLALLILLLISCLKAQDQDDDWEGWSCDDMTPDLCDDLKLTRVKVPTRANLSIAYFIYTPTVVLDGKSPVVVVNGGPGLPHNCVIPLKALACKGRKVIFYDQVGTGKSNFPPNTTAVEDFPFAAAMNYKAHEELPLVLEDAGVKHFHIVADSFGTMIALEFALNSKSEFRRHLISISLNSPIPHPKEYTAAQWDPQDGTLGRLPPYLRSRIKATEQDVESQEAQAIETVLSNLFTYRSVIPPDCALDSLSKMNPELFLLLEGPSDFRPWTGSLKNFDAMPRLGELSNLPMFLNSGEFDIVRPVIIEEMHAKLTLSETLLFAGSGHISVLDATGELNSAIADFLERVEESATEGKQFVPNETKTSAERTQRASSKVWRIVGSIMILAVGFLVGRYSGGANRYERL